MDDVDSDRRTADGVELALKHITHWCALELEVESNWLSDRAGLTLDFMLHTLVASAYSSVVASAVCAFIARLASAHYLFIDLNFSVWTNFVRQAAPVIDRADQSGTSPELTLLLAQLWRNDDLPRSEKDFSPKEAIEKVVLVVRRTVTELEELSLPSVSLGNGRQVNIEDLDSYFSLLSVHAESRVTQSEEDVSHPQASPSITSTPSTPPSRPIPSSHPATSSSPTAPKNHTRRPSYVAPTPYTDEEKSSGDPHFAGRRQWPRRPSDPVGRARNDIDVSVFDREAQWGRRSVAHLIEKVEKNTVIDMSRTSEDAAYDMYEKMSAADNLFKNKNLQTLVFSLFPKAGILDTMTDGVESQRLTNLLRRLYVRGEDGNAAQRRDIQGFCKTLGRTYKYSFELLKDDDEKNARDLAEDQKLSGA